MKKMNAFAFATSLVLLVLSPSVLAGQENSQDNKDTETYKGEPLCPNGHQRGVYPHPTYRPDPEYDNDARRKKIQGTVTMSLIVNKEGMPDDIKVLKSLTPGLDKQAVKAVSRWRFDPVTYEGKACPVKIYTEVMFRLY